jgi:hypothetical protein
MGYAVRDFFANQGTQALIVRVPHGGAQAVQNDVLGWAAIDDCELLSHGM